MQRILMITVLALLLAGCGRKGKLFPPEALRPAPVNDLQIAQKGERFQVSWSQPAHGEGGRPIKDLAGFHLFKREVLPPAEDCESCADAYKPLKIVDLAYLQDVRRVGGRLFLSDADVETGKTYQYKLLSFQKDGTPSRDSNKARRKKVPLPAPPRLKAVFSPTGVLLQWEGGVLPANSKVMGYNLYRLRADALPPLVPVNAAPMPGSDYDDPRLERGVTYTYTVRTVAEMEGVKVESEPSNEAKGTLAEPD
ncbi:MAG TPA: lipoprotein [Geobacteraceae bacterium]|nr:lipoprotein [Geobacteraceae bacterium]